MTFRLLLTSAGGAMSPLTIRCLKESSRHDVAVIAVDCDPDAIGRHFADVFEVVPAGDDSQYPDVIAEVARRHGADLILPCSDEEALALAGARETVEAAGARLACADLATLRLMTDKAASLAHLREAGISVPAWRAATDGEALDAAIEEFLALGNGFAVKPTRSRGGRDVIVIEPGRREACSPPGHRETYVGIDAFRHQYRDRMLARAPLVVMERLEAPAFDIDVLARNGEALRVVPRRRLNPAGIPFCGGTIVAEADLVDLGSAIARALNLSWLYDFDVMSDAQGGTKVIELNPRPSGSIAATVIAGVPILDDLVSLAQDEALLPMRLPDGRTVVPYVTAEAVA